MDLTTGADVALVPELDEQSFDDLFGNPETDRDPDAAARSPSEANE